jgi:serine/threonine protein kinase
MAKHMKMQGAAEGALDRGVKAAGPLAERRVGAAGAEIYRQLLEKEHMNIVCIRGVEVAGDGGAIVYEECPDGVTLRELLEEGVAAGDFGDYMIQLCDALEFLSKLTPPIMLRELRPENILIDNVNVLKLTNFEDAVNVEEKDNDFGDFAAVGRLIESAGGEYAARYRTVIKKCAKEYETFGALQKDIERRSYPFLIRNAKYLALGLMGAFLLARMLRSLLRVLFA